MADNLIASLWLNCFRGKENPVDTAFDIFGDIAVCAATDDMSQAGIGKAAGGMTQADRIEDICITANDYLGRLSTVLQDDIQSFELNGKVFEQRVNSSPIALIMPFTVRRRRAPVKNDLHCGYCFGTGHRLNRSRKGRRRPHAAPRSDHQSG